MDELGSLLAQPVSLVFTGPVDLTVSEAVADDVVAFVREGLTNIARHAHASAASVTVEATEDRVTVTVTDDGSGMGGTIRRSGLRNGEERARRHGGSLLIDSGRQGTRLTWSVPFRGEDPNGG